MSIKNAKEILARLEDHEKRIRVLEGRNGNTGTTGKIVAPKQLTLNEIIKGKIFKSGQQKVAIIIGYQEKVLSRAPVNGKEIEQIWKKNKFDGKFRRIFLDRAIEDGFLRDLEDGTYDLSQAGESLWEFFCSEA